MRYARSLDRTSRLRTRLRPLALLGALVGTLVLAACASGDGGGSGSSASASAPPTASAASAPPNAADVVFTGWPPEAGGYSTDVDPTSDDATYVGPGDGIVIASTVVVATFDPDATSTDRFEVGDAATCGSVNDQISCTVAFQDRRIELVSFPDREHATAFITDLVSAQGGV